MKNTIVMTLNIGKMNKITVSTSNFFYCIFFSFFLLNIPVSKAQNIALIGEIHVGNGKVFSNGTVLIKGNMIVDVLASSTQQDLQGYNIISVAGKIVYPGLIAPFTILGLAEVESVKATIDTREVGVFNPNVRALIAYNADSKISPTILSNGITTFQSSPVGGSISGVSSIFNAVGWNWEDAVVKEDDGMVFNWSESYFLTGWWAGIQENKKNDKYLRFKEDLINFITQSKSYCENKGTSTDLKFNAMCALFNGSQKAYVRVNGAYEIVDAVQSLQAIGIKKIVIVGGREAPLVVDFLKENKISVILQNVHALPRQRQDEVYINYKAAKVLQDAGVLYCFGLLGYWEQRNLPFIAGTSAAFGITDEEAISAITLNTAQILGIEDQLGSIEKGKIANIIVSKGNILDMKTSVVEKVFIEGKEVDINDHQKQSFEKYLNKYGLE